MSTLSGSRSHRGQCLLASALTDRLTELGRQCPAVPSLLLLPGNRGSDSDTSSLDQEHSSTAVSDAALLAQSFQYSRYLLLAAGSRSVMNLQGLWADGECIVYSELVYSE